MPTSKKPVHLSYLERLKFDPKLLGSWVAGYIRNIRVVILLIITIVLIGIMSYTALPKRVNPEVKIPIVTIVTTLPGAGPGDVESLLTIPLENQARTVKGIDTISSVSQNSVSVITLQFFSNVAGEKAKTDISSAIDSVRTLPQNAGKPRVNVLDFEDQPIWTFAVSTKRDEVSLMQFSKDLKRKIEDTSKVDRVVTTGATTQEVGITFDLGKMQQLGISPFSVAQTLQKSVSSYPAGDVKVQGATYSLTIDPQIETVEDISGMIVSVNGKSVPISSIARVGLQPIPGQQEAFMATPTQSATKTVTFYVYKTTDANIDVAGKNVKTTVDGDLKENPDYTLTTISNTSEQITTQFSDLLGEFRSTMILVFICLLLFLGLRQAIISSLTVPLTFLSAFFFMRVSGMSINFLSLFAFLLALGLLVDDTIVVVSAMTTYFKTGKFTPLETGLLVWKDTIVPIWSTTITTVWSFVPLLITSGIIGEFIKPIPIVVTVTMFSSTAIAVLITLPLMIILLKPVLPRRVVTLVKVLVYLVSLIVIGSLVAGNPLFPLVLLAYIVFTVIALNTVPVMRTRFQAILRQKKYQRPLAFLSRWVDHGLISTDGLSEWYYKTIRKILDSKKSRRQVLIAIVAYAIFSFALLPMGFVKNEFFPKSDQDQFFVSLELPSGTSLEETKQESFQILDQLRHTPESEFVTAEIGKAGSVGFGGGGSDTDNVSFFTVRLKEKKQRHISSIDLSEQVRSHFAGYTKGEVQVVEESGGPPAGADLQMELSGSDLATLDQYADSLVTYLQNQKGITNVKKSVKSGTSKLVFRPNMSRVSEASVGLDSIGLGMRTFASGFTLDSINFDKSSTEKTDVVLRIPQSQINPETIGSIMVSNQTGNQYPLLSLGKIELKPNPTVIARQNGKRTLTVTATVQKGFSTTTLNKQFEAYATSLHLPSGYAWKTGGVNEENTKSVQSILQAMILSAILILITMVVQFQSFRQALIVLMVIPLAVSSVFLAYALTGTPLSFPALIGILSLFGIVVTNSMFIVDKININLRQGMGFEDSIADAGASRMEPIILTKLCTVFGLLPITLADPLWRGLGGAIISGLLIASTIMLLFIPVLYYSWMKPSEKK